MKVRITIGNLMISIAIVALVIAGLMSNVFLGLLATVSVVSAAVPLWIVSRQGIPGADGKIASVGVIDLLILYSVFVLLLLIFAASLRGLLRGL